MFSRQWLRNVVLPFLFKGPELLGSSYVGESEANIRDILNLHEKQRLETFLLLLPFLL
jgi:SpoVK/Ycf46/Vps4 family AAA+-type ATPase